MKVLKYILNLLKYYTQNKQENFEFFKGLAQNKYPKGALFVYNGIEFHIKDFCSDEYGEYKSLNNNEDKVYIICEYYDIENKTFQEKIMHQDFVDYRIKQYKKILEGHR